MLTLIKMEEKYRPLLNEMMDEWTAADEKIIPYAIRKCRLSRLRALSGQP